VNHQLYRFAFEVFFVPFLNFLFFHGLSHFTLSFRVRKIGGASVFCVVVGLASLDVGLSEFEHAIE
jgi:hypothetical protein